MSSFLRGGSGMCILSASSQADELVPCPYQSEVGPQDSADKVTFRVT